MGIWSSWFRRDRQGQAALTLYRSALTQARAPEFYLHGKVPDNLDGRFDLLVLHVFLILRRLKSIATARDLSQSLFRVMLNNLDEGLRESGVGDMGIGRHIKQMAAGFYGRVASYEAAVTGQDRIALAEALKRNLYGTVLGTPDEPQPAVLERISGYVLEAEAGLRGQNDQQLLEGSVKFPSPPQLENIAQAVERR